MKQIASNYSYSPTSNVVTLAGVNIDQDQLLLIVAPQVGRTLYNFASVTGTVVAGIDTRVVLNASTAGLTTTSPLVIFYEDQATAQAVTGTVALDPASLIALENITVTVGSSVALAAGSAQVGSVTISNFPSTQTIAGTVTANVKGIWSGDSNLYDLPVLPAGEFGNGTRIPVSIVDGQGNTIGIGADGADRFLVDANITNSVTIGSLPAISGTVTANMFGFDCVNNEYSPIPVLPYNEPIDCGNTVIARLTDTSGTDLNLANGVPISGTVTANNPSGALTTRFGSVTTANTAQITSAVTNTSRKYLLAQNISAGTVTIGIGFSPTITQGIQLTAGGGLTFDAFCPTGAVYWLGAVTGANYCLIEG